MYDSKHGISKTEEERKEHHKMNLLGLQQTNLAGIEERDDSMDSDTILDDTSVMPQKKIDPEKLKEQFAYKTMMKEKEAVVPLDDGKISRDHGRHFMVSRVLGHDLDMPGASEWQVHRDNL